MDSKSDQSVCSIGIGQQQPDSIENPNRSKKFDLELIRPKAENSSGRDDYYPTFDCILFLIFCGEHDRFAVTDIHNDNKNAIIWLPFVGREGRNWRQASEEGLQLIFERRDNEGMVVNRADLAHTSRIIELCHLQTVSGRWIQRMTQFVNITRCNQTCQPINSIKWIDTGSILKMDDDIWGPEFCRYLKKLESKRLELKVIEFSIDKILKHHHSNERSDRSDLLPGLIRSKNLSQKSLLDLYEHYLHHTFPSYYLNYQSFKIYLSKCGFRSQIIENYSKRLFDFCRARSKRDLTPTDSNKYIDFHDICFLLIGFDPELPIEDKFQQKFIENFKKFCFTNFSEGRKKSNDSRDIQLKRNIERSLGSGAGGSSRKSLDSDRKSDRSDRIELDSILTKRNGFLSKSIFPKFAVGKKKKERLVSDKSSISRGLCRNCRVKNFEYGLHCVLFDSFGHCIEPRLILNRKHRSLTQL